MPRLGALKRRTETLAYINFRFVKCPLMLPDRVCCTSRRNPVLFADTFPLISVRGCEVNCCHGWLVSNAFFRRVRFRAVLCNTDLALLCASVQPMPIANP